MASHELHERFESCFLTMCSTKISSTLHKKENKVNNMLKDTVLSSRIPSDRISETAAVRNVDNGALKGLSYLSS